VSATVVARQTGLLDDEIFAGRAEFVDEDELAESELVTSAAVGVVAGAVAARERAPAGPYQGVPISAWPPPTGPGAYPRVFWGAEELAVVDGSIDDAGTAAPNGSGALA
jgi:hypothetical protein